MSTLRVCLLADFAPPADEGMKKTASELSKRLEKMTTVMRLDVARIFDRGVLGEARVFSPHIIHYFHGPTVLSLGMMRILALWTGGRTVISATHPNIHPVASPLLRFIRTDMILAQSTQMMESLKQCSGFGRVIPSGVDTEMFRPPSIEERTSIRKELGFESGERIGLHVGSLSSSRNLDWIARARKHLDRVLVVASTSTQSEDDIREMVIHSGCELHQEYIPNIERFYMASDVYLFPTYLKGGSIDFPLSVLEALATGLPVVTFPTPAIVESLAEGKGLVFIRDGEEIGDCINRATNDADPSMLRELSLAFSWDSIAERIVNEYLGIIQEDDST